MSILSMSNNISIYNANIQRNTLQHALINCTKEDTDEAVLGKDVCMCVFVSV